MRRLLRTPYRGKIKSVILDWSGTTLDAYVLAPAVAFVDTFKKWGVEISMDEARVPMGLRKDLHIKALLETPEIRKRFQSTLPSVGDLFKDFIPIQKKCIGRYCTLLPHVEDVTDTLQKDLGLKVGVTTGFSREVADIIKCHAKEQGFHPDFDAAGDDLPRELGVRPKPFMVYNNLVEMGIWPIESVVKVDDTVKGCQEAVNAGCWGVAVSDYSSHMNIDSLEAYEEMSEKEQEACKQMSIKKLMEESGAHYIIDTIVELPEVIKDINERLACGEKP